MDAGERRRFNRAERKSLVYCHSLGHGRLLRPFKSGQKRQSSETIRGMCFSLFLSVVMVRELGPSQLHISFRVSPAFQL